LTDLIKSRGKVGEAYPADMGPHRRIFDRELEIIQPTVIITFGAKVYDLLQFSLAGRGITIRRVWHYAYARRGADKAKAFEKQIRNALHKKLTSH
jgi:uracil-DNA glycosylase